MVFHRPSEIPGQALLGAEVTIPTIEGRSDAGHYGFSPGFAWGVAPNGFLLKGKHRRRLINIDKL